MQEAVKSLLVAPFLTSGYGVDIDQVLNAPFTVDYSEMVIATFFGRWHGPTGVRLMEPAYAAALLSGDGPADAVRLWPLMSADGTTLTFEETTDRDPACAPASAPAPRARGPRRRGVDRAVAETCQSLGRWTAHDGVFARATP